MILEGLLTTLNPDGSVHLAPMGPIVSADMRELVFRPFPGSTTHDNLNRTRQGVFHVTDDVELIAYAAVTRVEAPRWVPTEDIAGAILSDACRWYAFRVSQVTEESPRWTMTADVVKSGVLRDFFGLNRAKHAILEGAILATRLEFTGRDQVLEEFERLRPLIEKTGGEAEHRAFGFLQQYVRGELSASDSSSGNSFFLSSR